MRPAPQGTAAEGGIPKYRPRQSEKGAPCSAGCASGSDIRTWIGLVAQRDRTGLDKDQAYTRAWRTITDANPFPSVLGRICPHPCELGCNRTEHDGAVAINALERFLGDWAIDQGLGLDVIDTEPKAETIGVIGAGPSGLSFAYQMARRGYSVTVYERRPMAGGMLRYGVPDYRLPPEVLSAEIDRIRQLGVKIHTNFAIGIDRSLEELRSAHDILYLGIGAQQPRRLGISGEDGPGVHTGTEFLGRVNEGENVDIGLRVIVVGGGNTAIDAARVARRKGAEVTLVYRRTRIEMPAIAGEVDDALEEGVELELLTAPVEVVRTNGNVTGLIAQRMRLGEPAMDGRRQPEPVPDSHFELAADTVIAAVSQQPDWTALDGVEHQGGWIDTSDLGRIDQAMWAGGDVGGLDIAGSAITHGRRAAEQVHAKLRGIELPESDLSAPIEANRVNFDFKESRPPVQPSRMPVAEVLRNATAEPTATITEEEFLTEIGRCFSCGLCMGCQQCWMYCTAMSFTEVLNPQPGGYYTLSLDACEECGKCIEVCPCGYLELV
jgi:NADPH-dependent glutamate synthase beta subunit-like oxidoreductase/Pyruvate/2-oxoacid:ferredoxin oxidoreductase delta subunit